MFSAASASGFTGLKAREVILCWFRANSSYALTKALYSTLLCLLSSPSRLHNDKGWNRTTPSRLVPVQNIA